MDVTESKSLSVVERAKLENYREAVNENKGAVLKVAIALKGIRDEKLFRETHENFADFVRDEFHFEKSHAYRLCEWALVVDAVSPVGESMPNERQARELARLETTEEQQEAWEETLTATDGDPTAKDTRKVVDKKIGPRKPRKPKEFDHYQHAWTLCDEIENDIGEITEPDDLDSLSTRLHQMAELCDQKAEHEPKLKGR